MFIFNFQIGSIILPVLLSDKNVCVSIFEVGPKNICKKCLCLHFWLTDDNKQNKQNEKD